MAKSVSCGISRRTEAMGCPPRRDRHANSVWDDARGRQRTEDAPPSVLLHLYMATAVMWSPNMVDFSQHYRVYAIDTMGQPSKSIPGNPTRVVADYIEWLTATLDGLHVDRIFLVGMSFGGWLALNYALAAPERVQKLVLLSAGGFLPITRQFSMGGMLMMFFPTRFTVNTQAVSAEPF